MTTEQEFLGNEKIKRILLRDGTEMHIQDGVLVKVNGEPIDVDKYDLFILLNSYGQEVMHLDRHGKVLWSLVPPYDGPEYCPEREHHGNPLRFCNNCSWIEEPTPEEKPVITEAKFYTSPGVEAFPTPDPTAPFKLQMTSFQTPANLVLAYDPASPHVIVKLTDGRVIGYLNDEDSAKFKPKYPNSREIADMAYIKKEMPQLNIPRAYLETQNNGSVFDVKSTPTIGRIVHYKLTEQDAVRINKRRRDWEQNVLMNGTPEDGYQAHFGNNAEAGQVYPADIVRVWPDNPVNLQVKLDGNDVYWATSRIEGAEEGQWSWPSRG